VRDNSSSSWATLGECYREKLEREPLVPPHASYPVPPASENWDTLLISSSGGWPPVSQGCGVQKLDHAFDLGLLEDVLLGELGWQTGSDLVVSGPLTIDQGNL
jgi:hypothetical protein